MNLRRLRRGTVTVVIGLALGALPGPGAAPARAPTESQQKQLSLDEWRQRHQDYLAAFRETDPRTRVELLEKYLRAYPDSAQRPAVLQMLATSMLQTGKYDPGRVESLLKEISESPRVSCSSLKSVLQTYVDHSELSLSGARTVLQRADAMLARDRREAKTLTPKSRRQGATHYLEACEQSILALHGKLLLVRDDAAAALPILREAESKGVRLGIDLFPIDERGRTGGPLPTGRLDDLRLSVAVASERTGDPPSARQELSLVLGSRLSESERKQARDLLASLGVEPDPPVEVQAPLSRAPGLTLADLSGRKHRLRDYRGQVIVLNFWSTT